MNEKKEIHAGIDIGYSSTKVYADGVSGVIIPSVIGTPDMPITTFHNGRVEDHLVVEIPSDSQYLVGDSAIKLSRITQRREDRTWIGQQEYYILLAAALAIAADGEEEALIKVTTGLPVTYFDADREQLEKLFSGGHGVTVNGVEHNFRVDARVTTQGFGAYMDILRDNDGVSMSRDDFLSKTIGIIDIGGHTTNVQTIDRAESVRPQTVSFPIGGWDLVRSVQAVVANEFPDVELLDHQVAEAIVDKSFRRFGEATDISSIIRECAAPIVRDVLSRMSQLWGSASAIDQIYIVGGGAHLFGELIAKEFPHAYVTKNPVLRNARGYWKYTKVWAE
jgi:actin-like ATPase involved in cell morphogenesis